MAVIANESKATSAAAMIDIFVTTIEASTVIDTIVVSVAYLATVYASTVTAVTLITPWLLRLLLPLWLNWLKGQHWLQQLLMQLI